MVICKKPCPNTLQYIQNKSVNKLLKKGVEHVTPEMWTNVVDYVLKEEDKFWNIDFVSNGIMDTKPEKGACHILTIGIGDTSLDSNSD